MKNPNEVILSCRVSKDTKRELKRLAKEDRRTLASFSAMLLESALQARQAKEQAA
jgi:mRNA-degrading endonuclease RelE of RelBE toxin-antitoxin system